MPWEEAAFDQSVAAGMVVVDKGNSLVAGDMASDPVGTVVDLETAGT